jgi:hypothetical protein
MTIVRVLLPPSFPSLYAIHPPLSNDALTVALPGRLPPNLLPGWLAYHPPRAEVVLGPLHPHPPPGVGRLDNFAAEANAAEAHSHLWQSMIRTVSRPSRIEWHRGGEK